MNFSGVKERDFLTELDSHVRKEDVLTGLKFEWNDLWNENDLKDWGNCLLSRDSASSDDNNNKENKNPIDEDIDLVADFVYRRFRARTMPAALDIMLAYGTKNKDISI
jgi:hypothetical protein